MSDPRFDTYLKAVLARAEGEATDDGSATIEPQHMLLAIAAQGGTRGQRALAGAGLGHSELKAAFRKEFAKSLAAAGVSLDAFDLPRATSDPSRRPQPGAWFRTAMERTAAASPRGRMDSGHLLLGILAAEHGTVARALALAGVERSELIERVRSEP